MSCTIGLANIQLWQLARLRQSKIGICLSEAGSGKMTLLQLRDLDLQTQWIIKIGANFLKC